MLHIVKFRSQLLSQFFSLRQISASIMEGDKENNSKSTIETSSSHDEVLPGKKTSSTSTEAPMANVEKATGNVVTVNDGNSKKIKQKPCSNAILVINNDKGEMLQTYWSIVTNNPSDFMAWTRLLQLTEQQVLYHSPYPSR